MSEVTTRAAIKTLIESVSNIGLVYDNEPFSSEQDILISRFQTIISGVDMIRAWTISCEAIPVIPLVATGARDTSLSFDYEYHIRGYQSFNYSIDTENTFLALAILVMKALNSGIVSGSIYNANPAQLTSYTPRVFGGILCHVAEITQIVRDQV